MFLFLIMNISVCRPRGGDFLYTDNEFGIMMNDIEIFCKLGVKGIVVGVLTREGYIDIPRMQVIVSKCGGLMNITFHRAFDVVVDPFLSLQQLIEMKGVNRILTSGQSQSAILGKAVIKELVDKAKGKIIIMPGGGIDETNVKELVTYTSVKEVHCSGRYTIQSDMVYRPSTPIYMGGEKINNIESEFTLKVTSSERIRIILQIVKEI